MAVFMVLVGVVRAETQQNSDVQASDRILRKEVVVNGPLEKVWRCWTTSEGIASFFSPESKVELRPGGSYELYMHATEPDAQGRRGTQGCTLLSYIPHEMLACEWNFPPAVPSLRAAGAKTHVVLHFSELPDSRVRVRFAQLGWQKGEDWDKGYAYFDNAWTQVLNQFQAHMAEYQQDASSLPPPSLRTWQDGQVRVTVSKGASVRQDFEMDIPSSVENVWHLLATTEGLKRLGAMKAHVELRPGGAYAFWPGAPNKVLAFVPNEMLSTSGSAPPEFPEVRKGGTWSAYFLEPLGADHTRLKLSVAGGRAGHKEWDDAFDYFLRANPRFLNTVYATLSGQTDTSGAASTAAVADAAAQNRTVETASSDTSKASNDRNQRAKPPVVGPGDVLRHEAIVDAPVDQVWAAFTTREGIESWMVPHADIDLSVGGKMRTTYDPNGVLGDDSTIENTILSYDPQRMLSIKATRPPANFPHREAIENMWSVIYFEEVGPDRTRVIVVGLGYGDDEGSRALRQHFEKGNAWTLQQLQKRFRKPPADAR